MNSIYTVRNAIVNCLKQVKLVNNYANELPDDHIYPKLLDRVMETTEDASYPKCFVVPVEGVNKRLPSMSEMRSFQFIVTLIVKSISETDDAQDMLLSYLDDLERLFSENDTLLSTVTDVNILGFVVDGGTLTPEGAMILRLQTERYS